MSVGRESVSFGSVREMYFGKPERRGGDVQVISTEVANAKMLCQKLAVTV